jgi:hypothetical protein
MTSMDELQKISEQLGIAFHPNDAQDWGVINSQPERIRDFIEFLDANYTNFTFIQSNSIADLIISSVDELLLQGGSIDEIGFNDFLGKYFESIDSISYWISYGYREESPITYYIQKYFESI